MYTSKSHSEAMSFDKTGGQLPDGCGEQEKMERAGCNFTIAIGDGQKYYYQRRKKKKENSLKRNETEVKTSKQEKSQYHHLAK